MTAPRSMFADAMTSARSQPYVTAVRAVIFIVCGVAVSWASISQTSSLRLDSDRGIAEGRFVFTITAGGTPLSSADCENLRDVSWVVAAGAELSQSRVSSSLDGQYSFTMMQVTGGLIELAGGSRPTDLGRGGALAVGISRHLGLAPGQSMSVVSADGSSPATVAVAGQTATTRRIGVDRALLVPVAPIGPATFCYVETTPGATAWRSLAALFPPGTDAVVVRTHPGLDSNPPEARLARRTRLPVLAAAAVAVLAILTDTFVRRPDMALLRLLGAGTSELGAVVLADQLLVILPGSLAGISLGLALRLSDLTAAVVRHGLLLDASLLLGLELVTGLVVLPIARRLDVVGVLKGA